MPALPPTLEELEAEIAYHRALYEAGEAEISDAAFDKLIDGLAKRAPKSKVLKQVGSAVTSKKVQHVVPMLSLDKTKAIEKVLEWAKSTGSNFFAVMPKYDGVSMAVSYADGRLVRAVTRGDGREGDDVTALARNFLAPTVDNGAAFEFRGEVLFSKEVWERVKGTFEERANGRPVNARNAAAGSLLRKTLTPEARELCFVPHDVIYPEQMHGYFTDALLANGSDRMGTDFWLATPEQLEERLALAQKQVLDTAFPFETDGLVVKVADYNKRTKLGATSHHPKWALALKHDDEERETLLKGVQWQVSRTGTITPVAIVKPVLLSGVTVSRATLHHAGNVKRLKLYTDDRVVMTRRGGVIPHIERVSRQSRLPALATRIWIPKMCPCCGAETEMRDDFLFCTKPEECPDVQREKLLYWCKQTDMMGFGEQVIAELYNDGCVMQPSELYTLDEHYMQVIFGKNLGPKLVAEAAAKSELTNAQILVGLGIDLIGRTQAERLFEVFEDFDQLIEAKDGWCAPVPGMGVERWEAIHGGLTENENILRSLLKVLTIKNPNRSSVTTGPFAGKAVVFTGRMTDLERPHAQEQVRALGGTTPTSLTKTTDYLVVGSQASPEQLHKRNKAAEYNTKGGSIKVIEEETFLEMLAKAMDANPQAL
jgi:DNA ligase (NAD+)